MTNLLQHARRAFTWPYPSGDFTMGGPAYFGYSSGGYSNQETPPYGFAQLVENIFRMNSVVFACEQKRLSVFSDIRFYWQPLSKGHPQKNLFSNPDLSILENPWPRGTTSDLLLNMLLYADLGGNAFVARENGQTDRLRTLRPDWVTIVMGDSSGRPVESASQLDAEIIGFIYDPKDGSTKPEVLMAEEVCHWAPIPDPLARFRGMSWMMPILREIQADQAATLHKLAFFENGATPQMVVSFDASVSPETFEQFVSTMDTKHQGWRNAYKTLYLGGGATPTVVGKDLQQLDFSNTQGKGETRIAAASGIHPVLIPLSEGLSGSSLNAGNYSAARRSTADTTFRPLWRGVCGALQQIVPPPGRGTRLWFDDREVAFLREDILDLALVREKDAVSMEHLIRAGYRPETVRDAFLADDFALLEHTGMYSVQLQPPGTPAPNPDPSALTTDLPEAAVTNGSGNKTGVNQ